ncbi:MAG: GNAT family N-acetyltransferase [Woeseiaceae bacterium]
MTIEISLASIRHIDDLLPLVKAYHEFEGVDQDEESRRNSIANLLLAPDLGPVWLIFEESLLAGYIAICYGYSIEFGGRDGFIDEFYLLENFRGRGIGKTVLQKVLARLKADDIRALHLEVSRSNHKAIKLYEAEGFQIRDKYHLMSCALQDSVRQ